MLRKIAADRRIRIALLITAGVGASAVLAAYALGIDPVALAHRAKEAWLGGQTALRTYAATHPMAAPLLLYATVAVLPTFLLPVSPLLALCGAVLGPVEGTLIAGVGMMSNATGTFLLARRWRILAEPRVLRAGYAVPRLTAENAGLIIVPMRIVPGVPFVMQNYLLGLAGTPAKTFLFWILLIELPCASPYVLVGAGASGSDPRLLAGGAVALLGAAAAARILIKRHKHLAGGDA